MADFLKNNPMALRHCILLEVLQGTSIEKTYSNICSVILKNDPSALRQCILRDALRRKPIQKYYSFNRSMIGNEVIDYNNFNLSFHEFSTQKSNNKEGEKPIADVLRNDKYALRVCILYESLKYQSANLNDPIIKIFVNLCKAIGDEDVLKFQEFEFWFYRFLTGDYDLNYEKEEDKKIYELMDMPVDVMKNIAEYLDILDRMKLARTCRSLQTFVEDQRLFHHTLKLDISHYTATVSFCKSFDIQYIKYNSDCRKFSEYRKTYVRGVAYWKHALLDFKGILKNSKLYLNTLEISLYPKDEAEVSLDDLEAALKFNHYLNVKKLRVEAESFEALKKILPSLKPGYLTSIDINSHRRNVDSMEKVFETEQWEQTKYFTMWNCACFTWPLHHLFHLKKFTVNVKELFVEDIREMKEFLFKSPNLEKWLFFIVADDTGVVVIEREFGNYIQQEQNIPEYMKIYHYPIPNSTEYFEIKVEIRIFEVTRKKN